MLEGIFRPRPKEPWKPIPGSSQEFALDTRCDETLFHGARGPGKTDTQLMRFYRRVGMGYGAFWRGIIFDREYKNLDDIVQKSKRWFSGRNDGARFLEGTANYYWTWPTGETLYFRTVKREADYWDYHGQEYPFIGWNELCKFPTSQLYDMLQSCNRSSWTLEKDGPVDENGNYLDIPPIPLENFSTANPYGPGHAWVKAYFIDPAPNGHVVRTPIDVFNPKTGRREIIIRTRVAIFGSYKENPYLDPMYVAKLESEKDPNRRKAWLNGDWNIVAGGAFDDVYSRAIHEVVPFTIPANWRVDRSFDWGSAKPFACLWFAEANGEEVILPSGVRFSPVRGTIFVISELYGADSIGSNTGNKWSATKVAEAIKARDTWLVVSRRILSTEVMPGPADNEIRNVRSADTATIEQLMSDVGVRWEPSDKAAGSRVMGVELARERFANSIVGEGKAIYFFNTCRLLCKSVPSLSRDPDNQDDVDTESEDHLWDALRYRVLKSHNRIATSINVHFPT